jgi:tetratricopeptide (TPR) repeat protein
MWRHSDIRNLGRILFCSGFLLGMLVLPAKSLFAVNNCAIVHHSAPSEADSAYLAGDFDKAEGLYQAALTKNPGDADLAIGLVHTLLREQKLVDAATAVQASIGDKPASAALLTLRGEVELSQGEPWKSAETAGASAKLDPCNPRTVFLIARLAGLTSRYATARRLLAGAHQLDPADPEIRSEWMKTLPPAQRITEMEAFLENPHGENEQVLGKMHSDLEQMKKWAEEPRKPCTLASQPATVEIPFADIRTARGIIAFPALDVKVNGHLARLSIDTSYNAYYPMDGFSGLLIQRSAAEHMNLKPLLPTQVAGTGPQGPRAGSFAYADSISVGGVEYHDCVVQVLDSTFRNDADGAISMTLFSDYLVTLDYPIQKLTLGPLPVKPGATIRNGIDDGYIAPEMKDYTAVYRSGSNLMLPGSVNGKRTMLFVLDTAFGVSVLSPAAAHEVATGHRESKYEIRGMNSNFDRTFTAGNVSLAFAGLSQNIALIGTFDTSAFFRDTGMDVSGMIGNATLHGLTMRIDYRDGLVKLTYDSKKAGAFSR